MKKFFILSLFVISYTSKAEVGALFPNDSAILVIQGNDSDASNLFEAMNITPSENDKVITKHIYHETMYAKPVFDLTCKKSKLVGNASCTLKFFSPEAVINKEFKSVLVGINDQFDAPEVAKMFNQISGNPYQAEVFRSLNGKLHIWKTKNSSGEIVSFTMSYN